MPEERSSAGGMQDQSVPSRIANLRGRVYGILEHPDLTNPLDRAVNGLITTAIILNILALILGTVTPVNRVASGLFGYIEGISVLVFTIEYLLRVWSCTASPRYMRPLVGRLRFALTPFVVIDLLAIAPFYTSVLPLDLRCARVLRILRFLWFGRLGQHSQALQAIVSVLVKRSYELGVIWCIGLVILLIASSSIYFAEYAIQPEVFPNILAAMWWSVVTLTTVGYGDAYPITVLGKLIGAMVAITGILMFAMPTAIIGAGFYEVLQSSSTRQQTCPHCGETLREG